MFRFSFLTTLNIYKDYFKGRLNLMQRFYSWQVVEVGFKIKEVLKDWNEATIKVENFNSRALNALFCGVTNEEFKKISSTKVAKEA